VALEPDSAVTPTASRIESAPAVKDEDNPTHMNSEQELIGDSMHEPHDSIEVEIVSVFKNQLDLYKAEHQELTKVCKGPTVYTQ